MKYALMEHTEITELFFCVPFAGATHEKKKSESGKSSGLSLFSRNTLTMNRNHYAIGLCWLAFMLISISAHAQYPELEWAHKLGSNLTDIASAMATDASGNVYITGQYAGTADFDPGAATVNLTSAGGFDVFVAKFNAAGDLLWAKSLGGLQTDNGRSIAIDALGNVLITGTFMNTVDFNPGAGVNTLTSTGNWDVFVCKLDVNGDYVWAGAMGGAFSFDIGEAVAVDASNHVYVTGSFTNTGDFDPTSGTTLFTSAGQEDIFLVKMDGSTGNLIWNRQIGGPSGDQTRGLTIDAAGNVLATGAFVSTVDFDPGAGIFPLTAMGNDVFVLKLESDADFLWAVAMGGSSEDVGQAIKTDASGNVYSTGYFAYGDGSPHDFDPGAGVFHLTPAPDPIVANYDIYISKLSASGNFVWAKQLSGPGSEQPFALALDAAGNVYSTGTFRGTVDFDPGSGYYPFTADGFSNIYVSKLNASGDFMWTERPGGTYAGFGRGIAVDNSSRVITTGSFDNTVDFSAGSCDFNLTTTGQSDIFIQKLVQTGPPPPIITSFTPSVGLEGTVITLTGLNFDAIASNNVVKFNGTVATVTASSTTSITTSVPTGATTGFITVSVGCASGISPSIYTVDSCVPALEKNALQALYNYTDGSNWTNNANWLSVDVSTWYGVTVTGCTITEIQLGDNNLNGELPYDLVYLTGLEIFDVNENKLKGYIPNSFIFMPSLNTLNLSNNNFVEMPDLTTGSLSIATLDLDVSSNALDFGDLEPNRTFANFNYVPQAELSPSQLFGFTIGGTLTIDFSTAGTANAYQWRKEGVAISGATNPTLTISNATAADVGNYTVDVTNSLIPGLTLTSAVQIAVASPCSTAPRASGQVDVTFNNSIDAQTDVNGVALQSTGKVIVVMPPTTIGGMPVDGTVRFNADGALDPTFNIIPEYMYPLIQPDDKILGYASDQVIRYNADGTDDFAFNSNAPQSYSSSLYAMALQPDGKILYSAEGYMSSPEFTRLNTDGTVDPTFIPPGILASEIEVQADGKILIVSNNIVSRLNPDGTGDLSFSVGFEGVNAIRDLAIQPDGKIIIAGNFSGLDGVPHFGVARIHPDGTLDNTFIATGIAELGSFAGANKISLMSNGQIILAGDFQSVNGAPRKNLVKLNADGSLDCSFDPGTSTNDYIAGMTLQPDNKILITGQFTDYDGSVRNGLARINNQSLQITQQPNDVTVCEGVAASFTTNATGTTNIVYQWQVSPDGLQPFVDIVNGGIYSNATTTTLSINTTGQIGEKHYRCKVSGDFSLDIFTADEGLFVLALPNPPSTNDDNICVGGTGTLTASGGTNGQYRWYTVATGGTAITGETSSTYTTPALALTTMYYVSINDGTCESIRTSATVTVAASCNQPPAISATSITLPIEGNATISLLPLLSDPDNNLDLTSLKVIEQPASGAIASIDNNQNLVLDYSGINFSGTDFLAIEICDLQNACGQQQISIEVVGDLVIYNALSPNGDPLNETLYIKYIDVLPETKRNVVKIYNRWGDLVWETENYNNSDKVFSGLTNDGKELPSGTYYYKLLFSGKSKTGFISLKH
jgi:gliding motility-associated-like protein/uncharacterized delta-60 repeat protein